MHNEHCNYVIHSASGRFIGVESGHPSLTPAGSYQDVTGETVDEEIQLKAAYAVVEIPVETYGHPHCDCDIYDASQDSKRRDMNATEKLDYHEREAMIIVTNPITESLIAVLSSVAGRDVTQDVIDELKGRL